jgi:histidinol-phosphate aminotransferase
MFLVDEAFIEFGGKPLADLVPEYRNLIVTRTFTKAFSLAGLRVGYGVGPPGVIDWLNRSNDAYLLARPAQAAALACLEHREKIEERVTLLKRWTAEFAEGLERLGIKTYPTETYFFVARLPGISGEAFAAEMRHRSILVKAPHQARLGESFVRFATSTPENNATALQAIQEILAERLAV